MLGGVVVPKDIGRRFGIQFLPSFQKKTMKGTPSIEHGVIKSYNPADWHMFFRDLVTRDYMNIVGIAREKNSNGPDLMLPIQVAALADRTQLPANFYSLAIATKVYRSLSLLLSIFMCVLIIPRYRTYTLKEPQTGLMLEMRSIRG